MKNIFLVVFAIFSFTLTAFSVTPSASAMDKDVVILDVRTPEEFNQNHIDGSVNINFLGSDFKEQVSKLDKNKNYKLYCRSGNRSGKAMTLMNSMGFNHIENIGSLQQASKTLEKSCSPQPSC